MRVKRWRCIWKDSEILSILMIKTEKRSSWDDSWRSKGASVRYDWRTPDLPLKNFTLFKAEWCNDMKMMQKARAPCKSVARITLKGKRGSRETLMSFSSSFVKFSQTNASRRLSNSNNTLRPIKRRLCLVVNREVTANIRLSVNKHTEGELW